MKYKVGDRVRIKSLDWYNKNKDENGNVHCGDKVFDNYMSVFCGSIVTIGGVYPYTAYDVLEDMHCRAWTDEMIEGLVEEECPQDFIEKYCKSCGTQRCDRTKEYLNGCPYYNAYMCKTIEKETKPEPKFKRGDFVFSGIDSCAVKIINSCYDEHWRYQIFDDINEYWLFEKELKKVKIGDVVYSKVWKEKVIVRDFCDDKFILVANFKGKLLKSLPSLIKQIKEETKPESKFKVGDRVITDTNMKGKIIEVIEEGWYNVEFEPHNGIPQPNGVIPEESMSFIEEENIDCEKCGLIRNSIRCLFIDNCPHNKQKNIIEIPENYILKDECGNVINTTKIVLEKKPDDKLKLESTKKVREYWSEYTRICIEIYDDEPNKCVFTYLYTLESHRQKGHAKKALAEAELIAKELGCHKAYLKVETNSWMYDWYLRCGYNWYKNADEGYTWLTKSI